MQDEIKTPLAALDRERRLLFSVQVLRRLEPHYLHFIDSEGLDDEEWIPQVIDVAELFFSEREEAGTIAAEVLEEIIGAEPHSEDTPELACAAYALHACFDVLEQVTGEDPDSAVSVSSLALSAAEASGGKSKAEEELRFQSGLIEKIRSAPLPRLVKETFSVPGERPPADS